MIKLVIFDLDGVLVDAREIHYQTLNAAIKNVVGENYIISREEHLSRFDGLSTRKKLELLNFEKWAIERINYIKQQLTIKAISQLKRDDELIAIMEYLAKNGIKIACASNAVEHTVRCALGYLGIDGYFSSILGNDQRVINQKPNPAIFLMSMAEVGIGPNETLIVEDSPNGRAAAKASGAHTLFINNREDLTLDLIKQALEDKEPQQTKYKDKKLNVLIPMAGLGSRFEQAGYSFPKPLIEVNGKPMIQVVVESLGIEANYIYLVRQEHREKYSLDYLLNLITPGCKIQPVLQTTEGAACTTLLAKDLIDNDAPLLMANSDQYIEWSPDIFFHTMNSEKADAGILTFTATHPKWSFARVDDDFNVIEVAEKKPISNLATVGVYWWKHGKDYVKYAEQMIAANKRVNNEFYVCPVFNEAIADGKRVKIFGVNKMAGIGTPEDLKAFLERK